MSVSFFTRLTWQRAAIAAGVLGVLAISSFSLQGQTPTRVTDGRPTVVRGQRQFPERHSKGDNWPQISIN